MNTVIDFVKSNLIIRKESFSNPNLFNAIVFSKSINSYNLEMLKEISSKSIVDSSTNTIINRLEGLECLLNGKNFITKEKFKHFNSVTHAHPFIIGCYILAGQIFSDGNHRVVLEYLQSTGLSFLKSVKYIEMIDHARRNKNLSWENIHEFIEILISNIFVVKGEIELNKKIENMFI